jgi:hypothetical protein
MTTDTRRPRNGIVVALIVLGFGLIAAPAIFQMFSRAPKGGDMIDQFRPFMTKHEVTKLRGYLATIDAGATQTERDVDPAAVTNLGLDEAVYREHAQYLAAFERSWPGIDADMSDMLDRINNNLDNYAAVDALPPFPLFPWFFVAPGVIAVVAGFVALRARRRGHSGKGPLIVLVVIGIGLIAAPAVFQMFSRAPEGGDMIDDFRPFMTRHKVTKIQGYFVTIGNGEGELRNVALPAAALPRQAIPDVTRFVNDWPTINSGMAPVIGVMSDNVDNFAAVAALPPFALFPWFFVAPGVLIALLAGLALRNRPHKQAIPQ